MRGLELQDVFSMARIISKIDIADEIKAMAEKINDKNTKDAERAGIEFLFRLIGKASTKETEKEIYSFLADVLEVKIDDLRHMKPTAFVDLMKGADVAEWKDFFIQVVRLIRSA